MQQSAKGKSLATTKSLNSSSFGKSTSKTVSYNSLYGGSGNLDGKTTQNVSGVLKKRMQEKQGPTDWTHLGLKSKYRDEDAREDTWNEWKKTTKASKTLLEALNDVLPVVKVERHPVHGWYNDLLDHENETSNSRTKARLLMRRFVFDVQEMWLANLEHLHEHKPDKIFTEEENCELEDINRGSGLENRRDVREIVAMNHQIQSVSQKRTFANAYHTTRLPQVSVMLDYVPFRTPILSGMRPLAPHLDSIVAGLRAEMTGNNISLLDGPVCKTTTSFSIHVERLIPSADYFTFITPEVFWRVEMIETASLSQRVYVMKELDIAQYVVGVINSNSNVYANQSSNCVFRSDLVSLPFVDGTIEYEGTVEILLLQTVASHSSLKPLQIQINAFLYPTINRAEDVEAKVLQMQVSPAEIRILFHEFDVPLFDYLWWTSNDRSTDFWPQVVQFLALEASHEQVDSIRQPIAIVIQEPRSYNLVEGCLTSSQAASCAYELLSVMQIIPSSSPQTLPDIIVPHIPNLPFRMVDVTDQYNTTVKSGLEESLEADVFDPVWKDKAKRFLHFGLWEALIDDCSPLSTRANDLEKRAQDVPGSCEVGKKGLWYPDQVRPERERTQVAANFFRDSVKSTTDSILVNLTLALETAIVFEKVFAWESFSQVPIPYASEEARPFPSMFTEKAVVISQEQLRSPIEKRASNTVLIFESFPVEGVDYLPKDELHKPIGFKRYVPTKNKYGFREQIEVNLLKIDPHVDAHVYGITRYGAIPNNVGVNSRNIWHNAIAVSEHINRPRTSKDYHYIIQNPSHCGANIPTTFTTRMKAEEMVGLTSSALKHFEETYEKIKELKNVFSKQLALDAKIEKVENDLKVRETMKRRQIQEQLQRSLEKKLNKATKSEIGWRRRYRISTLVELQGNWERRRDDRTGLIFFHKLIPHQPGHEKYMDTCQWEVPIEWDGDMWNNPSLNLQLIKDGLTNTSVAISSTAPSTDLDALAQHKAAFAEPSGSWVPSTENQILPSKPNSHTISNSIGRGVDDEEISISSNIADKSYVGSSVATIDTANLEHIAEQLVSSDELMRVIARRLGLPESQIVPAEDLSSMFSIANRSDGSASKQAMNAGILAPRDVDFDELDEPEIDSDEDLWSDDEIEVGDFDANKEIANPEGLPQNQHEAAKLRRKEAMEITGSKLDQHSVPNQIPYLDLEGIAGVTNAKVEQNQERFGWRRLPRPAIGASFLTNALKTHTRGPDPFSCNSINAPVFLVPISPVDACKYVPEQFSVPIESLFIPDAKKDMERSVATLERNIRIEEELARTMPTDDLFLFGEAREFTSVDAFLAKQYKEDKAAVSDPKEAAKERALLAAKATNIAQMEDALAEDIPINTADEFGNTLLILSAQQGSKRMCKFLLRRGANINYQNLSGNTALHYCYAYGNRSLGDYLKLKGADDSIINVDGLTCYEGLNRQSMNEQYADYGEEDYPSEHEEDEEE